MSRLFLVCLATSLAITPALAAEIEEISIERIQTVIFPADGAEAAAAICNGLADGVLNRDGIGVDLARLQNALATSGNPDQVNRYVNGFNQTAQARQGCNIRISDPQNTDLYQWQY